MLEAVGLLAADRRARLARRGSPAQRGRRARLVDLRVTERLDRARPEHASRDGRAAQYGALRHGQPVDPGRDHRLDGVRDARRLAVGSSSIRTVSSMKSGLPSVVASTASRWSTDRLGAARRPRARRRAVALSSRSSASSSIDVARTLPPPHVEPLVEQVCTGEAEDQQRHVLDAARRGARSGRASAPRPSGCPRTRARAAAGRRAPSPRSEQPRRSPRPSAPPRPRRARPMRGRAGRRPPRRRSTSAVSRSPSSHGVVVRDAGGDLAPSRRRPST